MEVERGLIVAADEGCASLQLETREGWVCVRCGVCAGSCGRFVTLRVSGDT